ncbi:MAG: hypothetical protein PVI03_05685, partial [Candidatus Thorarchaeota archaeon]
PQTKGRRIVVGNHLLDLSGTGCTETYDMTTYSAHVCMVRMQDSSKLSFINIFTPQVVPALRTFADINHLSL